MSRTQRAVPGYEPYVAEAATPVGATARIASIDIVRGAVMVLMAIDHVRVYAGVPPGGPTPGLFFTRWVTHFCAPIFIFLAGTAAYLYGQRGRSRGELARFLFVRGLWLVLLELTILRFGWTFNFDYANFTFAGVIWAIGWSMVVLAALCALPAWVVGGIGVAIVFGHNALASLLDRGDESSPLLRVLYAGGGFELPGLGWNVAILYVLLPWVGVMAAGYGFGTMMRLDAPARRRICLFLGMAAVLLFVVLRVTDGYGDPRPWSQVAQRMPSWLAFLNTTKYPGSLQFMLMTLGPMLLVLPLLETARNRVARWLEVFGKVPFFYYVLHIPLIHVVAVLISLVRTPDSTGWLFANHPLMPPDVPAGYMWSLPMLYLVTTIVVVALYFPCRWYAAVKARSSNRLLSFL